MNLKPYISDFISLIYPNLCIGCDAPLPRGSKYICPECHYNLPKTNTLKQEQHIFKDKFDGIVPLEHVLVYAYFIKGGIMQHILHDLKYNDNQEIGIMIGRWYGHDLLLGGYSDAFDAIVPVPLHSLRLKERGYNQAACFAEGLSEVLKLPVLNDAVEKTRNKESQTSKSKVSRIFNVEGVFKVNQEEALADQRVLLVDDVLTTGSTLIECSEAILKSQVKTLSIAVMAGVK